MGKVKKLQKKNRELSVRLGRFKRILEYSLPRVDYSVHSYRFKVTELRSLYLISSLIPLEFSPPGLRVKTQEIILFRFRIRFKFILSAVLVG